LQIFPAPKILIVWQPS